MSASSQTPPAPPPAPPLPTPLPAPAVTPLSAEYVAAAADLPAQAPSGGDFHDAFVLPGPDQNGPGGVAVVIGDVAGHGPEQTAQAEHMRALLGDSLALGLAPAEALAAVNAMVEPDPHFEGFATVFVGVVEDGTGRLTYASGGHEPALVAPADAAGPGDVAALEGTGPPVGAFPPELARYEQREAAVPPNGTLLLYTDGVPDARPPEARKNWLGLGRLRALLAGAAALPPARLLAAVLAGVARHSRGRFDDDVALLALRRRRRDRQGGPPAGS